MSAAAFAYRPVPLTERPRPCQGCWEADAVVAVWRGGVWRLSLCAACALAHREAQGKGIDVLPDVWALDKARVDNAVLRRLIAEVRNERVLGRRGAYDRIHNRHNRNVGGSPLEEAPDAGEDET